MANIRLGLATSHSPQLSMPPKHWVLLAKSDTTPSKLWSSKKGVPVSYEQLLEEADPALSKELSPDVMERRYQACQKAIDRVAEAVQRAEPDVIIAIGDDQNEVLHADNMPMFQVYYGDSVQVSPRDQVGGPAFLKHSAWAYGREERSYPVASDLATDLIRGLVERDFDVSTSKSLPGGRGIGHAFAFIYERVLNGKRVPMIPIMFNDFFAPNQPTPGRAYDFGTAIREIVREWPSDKNVCVIASGGLSHFVIDVELDEWILKALQNKDVAGLRSLQRSALQSGTSEALNWIATAAAADELSMKPIDFIPCYRTPAGTGCAMGFARWD